MRWFGGFVNLLDVFFGVFMFLWLYFSSPLLFRVCAVPDGGEECCSDRCLFVKKDLFELVSG